MLAKMQRNWAIYIHIYMCVYMYVGMYVAGGSVKWYSYTEEQFGIFLKN